MDFRTELSISPGAPRINHSTRILTLGSCFANVMGDKLYSNKFSVSINPFGVLFNPISIFKLMEASAKRENLFLDSLVENNGIWYNYDLHSDLSAPSKQTLQNKISHTLSAVSDYIQSADIITLTFGTAFVYKLAQTGKVVANCHKVPASNFKKELLDNHNIANEFAAVYTLLLKINPQVKVILTVSPVRHIKGGLEQNSLSKSILRNACHTIQEKFPEVAYFPSYEIMMDDLRDYRFYKEDMIHPTEVAENYIWGKFTEKYLEPNSQSLIKEWQAIRKAIEHKPFHPESSAHQKFIKETIGKLEKLSTVLNVQEEIKELKERIIS